MAKSKDTKPAKGTDTKGCAFKLPVATLARLKAYALVTDQRQTDILRKALDKHLDRAIAASGKQTAIAELVKTYGGK